MAIYRDGVLIGSLQPYIEDPDDGAMSTDPQPRCPRCQTLLVLRSGRFGDFYGCGNFPHCRFTVKTETVEEAVRRRVERDRTQQSPVANHPVSPLT